MPRLQGLSLVESLRQPSLQHGSGTPEADKALPPLFAAAAAFRPEADSGDASVALCRSLLARLQRGTLGAVPQEGPTVGPLRLCLILSGQERTRQIPSLLLVGSVWWLTSTTRQSTQVACDPLDCPAIADACYSESQATQWLEAARAPRKIQLCGRHLAFT